MKRFLVCTFLFSCLAAPAVFSQTVTLDYYFNHETRKTPNGPERFHYTWTDKKDPGFAIWGDIFTANGFKLDTLGESPTLANLKNTAVYIIVDPDSKKESPNPNYITEKDADQIAKWVKAGGVLVLMANDSNNVELPHFNILAGKFGLHFNNDLPNHVINDKFFANGEVVYADNEIFTSKPKLFLKDVCSIGLNNKDAKPVFRSFDGKDVIAATVKYGKGTVFAVGDPWLYNEYVNGRLPSTYQNDIGAKELTIWLKKLTKK